MATPSGPVSDTPIAGSISPPPAPPSPSQRRILPTLYEADTDDIVELLRSPWQEWRELDKKDYFERLIKRIDMIAKELHPHQCVHVYRRCVSFDTAAHTIYPNVATYKGFLRARLEYPYQGLSGARDMPKTRIGIFANITTPYTRSWKGEDFVLDWHC